MNDTPTSKPLESFTKLVNGPKQVEERGGTPNYGDTPPANKRWTHRFKESGQAPEYELFDEVWLSPQLAKRQMGAFILRPNQGDARRDRPRSCLGYARSVGGVSPSASETSATASISPSWSG